MPNPITMAKNAWGIFCEGYREEEKVDDRVELKASKKSEKKKSKSGSTTSSTELKRKSGRVASSLANFIFTTKGPEKRVAELIQLHREADINRTPRKNIADIIVVTPEEKAEAQKNKNWFKKGIIKASRIFVNKKNQTELQQKIKQGEVLFEMGRATHQTVEHATDFHKSRILNSALPVTVMWIALMALVPNKKRWLGSIALMSTPLMFASKNQVTDTIEDWKIKNAKVGATALKGIRGVHKAFGFFRKQVNRNFITAGALVALIAATRMKMIPNAAANKLVLKGACVLSAGVASHAWAWEAKREINNLPTPPVPAKA